MRRIASLVVLGFALAVAGCAMQPPALTAIEANWSVIGPRYKAYVEADPKLADRPDIRADWLKTAEAMDRVIAEAKRAK